MNTTSRAWRWEHRVQDEDLGICEAVQRGLKSRAYGAGRLSVRREAGEHLFHRLLAADLKSGARYNGRSRRIKSESNLDAERDLHLNSVHTDQGLR